MHNNYDPLVGLAGPKLGKSHRLEVFLSCLFYLNVLSWWNTSTRQQLHNWHFLAG
ncbi:hypothetical protein NEUTE1DRAFT_119212 [Neurospora tetrasperma FGSC 2508]|uniref:Uncharacterized protein n=1 Tax=Neurospora tetrasperma (strain FGSC 2508 / ATCC MYA-4615 / P0657) TaxID=510951 RepID=F8N469_NEUT8|nr:uncharacterized protein NEUTE1DRAFT_119212 [Neurospora tetrasperma FGSC 2508]EGO53512.1 hypothetical protein NEUTE1DRAFT_119212 [Neurospora tetrasperma FGSC 2508]